MTLATEQNRMNGPEADGRAYATTRPRGMGGRTLARLAAGLGLAALAVALQPGHAAAQTDPRLIAAVRLAQEGQADSARGITRDLLGRLPITDTLYPQALFAAAAVAATAPEMEKALRRIVVEYPSSEWVDDALLRLAQLDYGGGDVQGAAQKLERLKNDFPTSPLLTPASLWAARSYFELRNRTAACKWLEDGRARAGADVEAANQLAYYQQRCSPQALMADAPTLDTVKMGKGDTVAVAKGAAPKPGAAPAKPAASKPVDAAPAKPGAAPKPTEPAKTAPTADSGLAAVKPAPKRDSAAPATPTSAAAPVMDSVTKAAAAAPSRTPAPAPRTPAPTVAPAPSAAAPTPTRAATPPAATPVPAPAPTPAAAGAFRLQLAAMPTDAQARQLVTELQAKGIAADVTSEAGYFKVRTGRFATRAAAQAALPGVQQKAGTAPFIVRAAN